MNWKEPPLPVEHHRPGLTRRVLLRHPYTPWVPLTAWDRYSWSGGACPIMPSCHGARQVPPLPAAAAVLEHSSGEGWLILGGMGDVDRHPLLPKCTGLFPTAASSSPLQRVPAARPHCSHGDSTPGWHGDMFPGAISGLLCRCGEHPGMAAPLLSYVWLRVVRPFLTSAEWGPDVAGAGTEH